MTLPAAPPELRQLALEALLQPDPQQKVLLAHALHGQAATLSIADKLAIKPPASLPGCPARPELRSHLDVPKRSPYTPAGLAALLHAVTHIEFNAINLTHDAINFRIVQFDSQAGEAAVLAYTLYDSERY